MQIEHDFFGALDTGSSGPETDVIWEHSLPLHGGEVEVWLWAVPGATLATSLLDAFAARLQDLPGLDGYARQQLVHYLTQDRFYIEHHVEQLVGTPLVDTLAPHGDAERVDVSAFVAAMALTGIGLWSDNADAPVVMDYMLDPENSDEILVVNLTVAGKFVDISWES